MIGRLICFLCLFCAHGFTEQRVRFSGAVALDYMDSQDTRSHFITGDQANQGNTNFGVNRMELYFDAPLAEDTGFYGQLDWDGQNDLDLSLAYLRFDNAFNHGSSLDFGRILHPVGRFIRRKNPQFNPLFGAPLIYDYRTNLRSDSYPTNAAELLALKGNANRNLTHTRNFQLDTVAQVGPTDGMPLISQDYPTGLMYYVRKNNVDYYLGITNNSLSNNSDQSLSNSKNLLVKLEYIGSRHSRYGFSYSSGTYLDSRAPFPAGFSSGDYLQRLIGLDYHYKRARWDVKGELVFNTFESPRIVNDLETTGYYLEGQYYFEHTTYAAVRFGGLSFGDVRPTGGALQSWDDDISRVEFGLGHYVNEDVLGKLFIQNNSQKTVDFRDNILGVQLAAVF